MPYQPERHGPHRVVGPGFHERVWKLVQQVPAGKVTTYGDIAAALGLQTASRHVGYALAAVPPDRDDVPWHRVINSTGKLSARGAGGHSRKQARLLAAEGVEVRPDGRVRDFAHLRADLGGPSLY